MPLYIVCLITGLLAGTFAMLYGMRRAAVRPGAPTLPGSAALVNWTVPAAALTGFGFAGALARQLGADTTWLIAVAGGATTTAVQVVLSRWALLAPTSPEDEPEHRIQGVPATVVASIEADSPGRIRYAMDGTTHDVPARSIDGAPIEAGRDVVIERLDGDTAIVEDWASVETRL
jgi:membrane protein implicated in regulation of membrane protease activity